MSNEDKWKAIKQSKEGTGIQNQGWRDQYERSCKGTVSIIK